MRLLTIPVFFLAAAVATRAADNPGIIKGTDQFEFVYQVKLPEIKGEARVWVPLAKTDAFQTVTEEKLSIPMKWEKVQDRDYGNDICVIYPQPADSGKMVEIRYRVVRKEKVSYSATEAEAAHYLRPEKLVPINETFKTLAQKATVGKTDDLERAKALYDHVMGKMRYDKSGTGWVAVMRCTHVTREPVTVLTFTPISLHWRAASASRLALRSVQPFLLTKTRARSTAIIVGQNSWQMVGGFPLISAKHGRIQSWRITISGITRLSFRTNQGTRPDRRSRACQRPD